MIVDRDNFQLRGHVREYAPDQFDLTLEQCYPLANHPFWLRIVQLNLSSSELDALAAALIRK